jgi:hydrogenase maturation protein HypF
MKYPSVHIIIKGAVQGVGYRPFVYRIAQAHGIRGWVRNDGLGVMIEAVASKEGLNTFVRSVTTTRPPLAKVQSMEVKDGPYKDPPESFAVVQSERGERIDVDITRDSAVCEACLAEMRDPANRRFGHPFVNCTDCGPRYTIIKTLPYDRPGTTMADFPMCPDCAKEYASPGDRRFHAQPICCPNCGPRLSCTDVKGVPYTGENPLRQCIDWLVGGKIMAIKGIGGFHLACNATNAEAVSRLRSRKMREEKPLAVMMGNVENAGRFAEIDVQEKELLESLERPIVICKKNNIAGLAPNIAPGVPTLGIMLPYTPLHHLLFDDGRLSALVMTSGNLTDEPIVYGNESAFQRLGAIADAFLTHDRDIYIRNDDSIARVMDGAPVMLRRSRGYVPEPLPSPDNVNGLIALGGVLKSTIAIGRKRMCYLSQYVGAITTIEGLEELRRLIDHFARILDVTPIGFVADLHPQSIVRFLPGIDALPLVHVQHHHAHGAACMAENELSGKALCVVYDGTGYGSDGNVWGGELLLADYKDFTRLGHLAYLPLPGSEAAINNPGRMALSALYAAMGEKAVEALPWMPSEEKNAVLDMIRANTNCAQSSSMGRLFDAASAMLGICKKRTYEGQPAIELEGCADVNETGEYDSLVSVIGKEILIDGAGILLQAYHDFRKGAPADKVAARFHTTMARATADMVKRAIEKTGCAQVCLSGGCFQNALLLMRTNAMLKESGIQAFTHRRLPPNDECIAYGQLVVAGARGKFD